MADLPLFANQTVNKRSSTLKTKVINISSIHAYLQNHLLQTILSSGFSPNLLQGLTTRTLCFVLKWMARLLNLCQMTMDMTLA
mmetsp:Transcript_21563/g.38733  ORF Transcript_21563/g.38733 Transcript_21563/m.38733 type:complete len:83 (-) Transcript_21563:139-387(-)